MKTAPGPKELAQRELGQRTREAKALHASADDHERAIAARPVQERAKPGRKPAPKPRALIPYAGKPRGESGVKYGTKPGPKGPRKPKP